MVRFLAIDIDGTLLDSRGAIPERNRAAIAGALARGVEVALVTGRSFRSARRIGERLGLPVLFICSNGAVLCHEDGSAALRRLLPASTARDVLAETIDFRAEAALLFDRSGAGQIVSGGIDWTHPLRATYWKKNQASIVEVLPLENALTEDPIQVMFNGPVARMRALAAHLAASPCAPRCQVTTTEYAQRDFTLVDVLAPGVTKGAMLRTWAARRGYARGEMMAVGDNYNDREMLDAAGIGVAMGNAVPELLAAGYHVTDTNDNAGLARAVDRFVLQETSAGDAAG